MIDVHGRALADDYAWLRDPNYPEVGDPEILAHLEAENAYFNDWAVTRSGQIDRIQTELRGRIKQDDRSTPVRDGRYEYHWAFQHGAQYRCWYRREWLDGSPAEILLDEPAMAEGQTYFSLRGFAISTSADRMAYATDTIGDERYRIRFRDLSSGDDLDFEVPNCSGSMVWDDQGRWLFYVELNDKLRPFRVRRFDCHTPKAEAAIVFEEDDPGFFVSLGRTSDRKFLCVYTGDHVTREALVLPLAAPDSALHCISSRRDGHRYSLDHANGYFFIITNDLHENFRLARTPDHATDEADWEEVIGGTDDNYLIGVDCFADFFVLSARTKGQSCIQVHDYRGQFHTIDFGMEVYAASMGDNREFATDQVRVTMSSPITPGSVFDYDVRRKQLTLRKMQEIPSGFDATRYDCTRLWADAEDGARVPITIIKRKDIALDGTAPMMLYGYGAYGLGLEPAFSANRFSLINRGIIHATAHVRGGDELGHAWYRNGKLANKINSFTDFITCRDTLVEHGYACPDRVAIMGGSAGGMLVGAVLNLRPDAWAAVIAQVPFVDVLNTMLDQSLPLTPIEWPEWGNPIKSEADFLRIQAYSPYDNVKPAVLPPILATAGISDPRVTYWEPAKWVAKLRDCQMGEAPIYLKTNMGAGHFGMSGRFDALTELAQVYTFVLEQLGVDCTLEE